ncbi:MAG TPA: hypothetical protein VHU61_18560 [Solirubrobacteraceae bacterium]|jgi:hypothetical protein|nr:hypothetical protein [Solirubrobacteraceae bacterium]
MSTITTDLRATAARTTALRAAEGVIAGYIHSLAREAAKPADQETTEPVLGRLMKHAYECGASHTNGIATRRRRALQRVPSPA